MSRSDGEFRFAELSAGSYKLLTHELLDRDPLTFNPRGQLFGYPPVYYPAAPDFCNGRRRSVIAGRKPSMQKFRLQSENIMQ